MECDARRFLDGRSDTDDTGRPPELPGGGQSQNRFALIFSFALRLSFERLPIFGLAFNIFVPMSDKNPLP